MRFRFTPLVRKFSKFANIVIKDFIQSARNLKCLKKEFPELETGYDYAIAYISHFSKLKRKNILFQKQYIVNFGTGENELYVTFSKKDETKNRAEFITEGVIIDKNKSIPLLNVFLDKIRSIKLKSLRKRFDYIEAIRKYIVHELAHYYQYLKFNAFVENKFYVTPDKSSKYFLLESFLYSFQKEELEAIMYEALHTWNIEKHKRSVADIFIGFIAEDLDYGEVYDNNGNAFFSYINKNGSLSDRITCDYIFNTYIPNTKFAKYFTGIKCKRNKKSKSVISKMTSVYKDVYDGFPIPKKYVSACKNIFTFNNLLEEL